MAKFGVSVLILKIVRDTETKSTTKLFSIIDLVREDTFRTVITKLEGVKGIFVWFPTLKSVTRYNADEKVKVHTSEHPYRATVLA